MIPIVGRWTGENPGTISLGQGIVHYPPPPEVFRAVADASTSDRSVDQYGPVAGNEPLLTRMREKLQTENGIALDDAAVVCSAGANMAFINVVLAIADVGDEIILLRPYYFNHDMAIEIAGCRAVHVATDGSHQPDLDQIEHAINAKTKAVVTVSPNNPTGAVYSPQRLKDINALCARHGVFHISDEAYEYFLHDEAEHYSPGSIAGADAHTISLFSLSKSYGMAGWRVGYGVFPNSLLDAVSKVQDTNLICPPKICQVAAEAALNVGSEWCREQSVSFTRVRDAAIQELSLLEDRCRVATPEGAFYLFLDLESVQDDMELVEQLIREHGVAVLPGSAFGSQSDCSLRVSYGALAPETAIDGVGRLRRGLDAILR